MPKIADIWTSIEQSSGMKNRSISGIYSQFTTLLRDMEEAAGKIGPWRATP